MKRLTTIIALISILGAEYGLNAKSKDQLRAQRLLQSIRFGKMISTLSRNPVRGNFSSCV